jgi:hypothetical protein
MSPLPSPTGILYPAPISNFDHFTDTAQRKYRVPHRLLALQNSFFGRAAFQSRCKKPPTDRLQLFVRWTKQSSTRRQRTGLAIRSIRQPPRNSVFSLSSGARWECGWRVLTSSASSDRAARPNSQRVFSAPFAPSFGALLAMPFAQFTRFSESGAARSGAVLIEWRLTVKRRLKNGRG